MKINAIIFKKHIIFQDLTFNFETNDHICNKIILAGENGTGKSLLLEMINCIWGVPTERTVKLLDKTAFIISIDKQEKNELISHQYEDMRANHPIFPNGITENKLFVFDGRDVWFVNNNNEFEEFPYSWDELYFIKFSSYINGNEDSTRKTKNNNSTYCGVDFFDYDVSEIVLGLWRKDVSEHINKAMGGDVNIKFELPRINSINKIISKHFNGFNGFNVVIKDSIEDPLLMLDFRSSKNLDINYLSSGEKQLLSKILFICQKVKSHSVVLIDEPENNLHPRWQSEILDIYDELLNYISSGDTIQCFVATHSPFIIHRETKINEKTFILQHNGMFKTIAKESKFYSWTNEEIIQEAFSVKMINEKTISNTNETIIITEGKTDLIHIRNAFYKLGLETKNLIFHELPEGEAGDVELLKLAKAASKIPRKIN